MKLQDGILDFEQLQTQAIRRGKNLVVAKCWVAVESCMRERAPLRIPLPTVLERCGLSRDLTALVAQVVWQLSVLMEKLLGRQSHPDSTTAPGPLELQWKDRRTIF